MISPVGNHAINRILYRKWVIMVKLSLQGDSRHHCVGLSRNADPLAVHYPSLAIQCVSLMQCIVTVCCYSAQSARLERAVAGFADSHRAFLQLL